MATAIAAPIRPPRAQVFVAAVVGCVLAAYAVRAIAGGIADLRWAYLYRERTNEGIALVQVGFRLIGGGIVAVVALACFGLAAVRTTGWLRRWFAVVTAAGGLGLMACAAVAVWLSEQSGCLGPCG